MNPLNLTEPQISLLLKIRQYPRRLDAKYRPLIPLVDNDLVRPHVATPGRNQYELTERGKTYAQSILEARANAENRSIQKAWVDGITSGE